MTALLMAAAATARAQGQAAPDRAFISVGFGAQPTQNTAATSQTFSAFGENGSATATVSNHNGPVIEFGGGYRLNSKFAVGATVTAFQGRKGVATLTASVPDPLFIAKPKTTVVSANDLGHRETAVHVQALFLVPVSNKIDVTLSAGPSLVQVHQDFAKATVSGSAITAVPGSETKWAPAFNIGMDALYAFGSRYGAGIFARYVTGTADLPSVPNLSVGGLQTGLDFRVRF